MRRPRRAALSAGALATLLALPELSRAWHAVTHLAGLAVGVNSPLSVSEAFFHATGLASGAWDDRAWLLGGPLLTQAAAVCLLAVAVAGLLSRRRLLNPAPAGLRRPSLVPCSQPGHLFRWVELNPWDGTLGNPWRQARAAAWATYPSLFLLAAGLAALWRRRPPLRLWLALSVAGWLAAGAYNHYRLAEPRLYTLRISTACQHDCIAQLMEWRSAALHSGLQPIYLADFAPDRGKTRQFLTYLLSDHRLLSDWTATTTSPGTSRPPTSRPAASRPPCIISPFAPGRRHPGCPSHALWPL